MKTLREKEKLLGKILRKKGEIVRKYIERKGEIARNEQFLLFPLFFFPFTRIDKIFSIFTTSESVDNKRSRLETVLNLCLTKFKCPYNLGCDSLRTII